MKKQYYFIPVFFLMLMSISCGPSKQKAIEYNDAIIDQQMGIVDHINRLYDSFGDLEHPPVIEAAYRQAINKVDSAILVVSAMGDFDGKTELREASLKLFAIYKSVLQTEIKTMVEILKKPNEEVTPEMESLFEKTNVQAFEKMDNGLKEFQETQNAFAGRYNFKLNQPQQKN